MAEVIVNPDEGRVGTMSQHDLARECYLARLERDAAREQLARAQEAQPAQQSGSKVAWIVSGVCVCLFMVISFAWGVAQDMLAAFERHSARQHETTMAALDVASAHAASSGSAIDPTSAGVLGALLALAAICIIIGCIGKLFK